jgi:hypothetical protein
MRIDQVDIARESGGAEIVQDQAADRFLPRAGADQRDRSRLEQSVEAIAAQARLPRPLVEWI